MVMTQGLVIVSLVLERRLAVLASQEIYKAFQAFASLFGHELPVIDAAEKVNELEKVNLLKGKFKQAIDEGSAKFESLDFKGDLYFCGHRTQRRPLA